MIGNGPSLKVKDLEVLKDEVTIASNKVYLAFDQTNWRPTFLTVVDSVLWPKIKEACLEHYDKIHLSQALVEVSDINNRKLFFWKALRGAIADPEVENIFSEDLSFGIHGGFTVTFENLQLAYHLGLNPIYIIGCDHYYAGESGEAEERVVESRAVNHFHPDYRKPGEMVNSAPIEKMNRAYRHARVFADRNDLEIYNATRGGYLEAFERCDFDSIFL